MRFVCVLALLLSCRGKLIEVTPTDSDTQDSATTEDTQDTEDTEDTEDTVDTQDTATVVDVDGDGFPATEDCDDANAAIFPGAEEICDNIDNDCDGDIDENATDAPTWYGDSDGDGYGGGQFTATACEAPNGYVATSDDCDDLDADSYPGATETCDLADNDCDGVVDEDVQSTWYADADGDGYGDASNTTAACSAPTGYTWNGDDCDDTAAATSPLAYEICDGIDNNCDGSIDEASALNATTWYLDADSDGYGAAANSLSACDVPSGYVDNSGDCDDTDTTVNPSAAETCDNIDNDCDGTVDVDPTLNATTWYADSDSDGFGDPASTTVACSQPSGYVADASDCDDSDATSATLATDGDCDGIETAADCDDGDATTGYCDSCESILNASLSSGDGNYWIDPTGSSPFQAWCDMTTNGGGWTLLGTVYGGDGDNWNEETGNWASQSPLGSLSDPWSDFKSEAWYSLDITSSDVLFVRRYAGQVQARTKLGATCQGGKTLFSDIFTTWDTSIYCDTSSVTVVTAPIDATGLASSSYMEGSGGYGLGNSGTNGFCWNGGDSQTNIFQGHAGWNQSAYSCYGIGHLAYLGVFSNNGYAGLSNSDVTSNNWMGGSSFFVNTTQVAVSFLAR